LRSSCWRLVTQYAGKTIGEIFHARATTDLRFYRTAREAKADILRTKLSPKYPLLEIAVVNDVASDNVKDVLSGSFGSSVVLWPSTDFDFVG